MFGKIGWPEILIILFIILILFGAKRIPELARSMGQGMKSFKKGLQDVEKEADIKNSRES